MATQPDQICIWVRNFTDTSPPTLVVQEAALQTFVKGELVQIVSGFAQIISSDFPPFIYGIADEPAHNDAVAGTHEIQVTLCLPDQIFEANMKQAGLVNHALAQTDLGTQMGLIRDVANHKVFLNASVEGTGVANTRVFVHVARGGTPVIGDINARCHFSFIPQWVQSLATS